MPLMKPQDLLAAMPRNQMMRFYDDLLLSVQQSTTGCDTSEGFIIGFDLKDAKGRCKGKGLVATRSFDANEEILRERPFVAVQSLENRRQVLACANCFRFVGSVELQIAWRLLAKLHGGSSVALDQHACAALASQIEALACGELRLPFPHLTWLPRAVPCPNGCPDVYCCSRCAAEAWQREHCLLCRGACTDAQDLALRSFRGRSPYLRDFEPLRLARLAQDRAAFGWLLAELDIPVTPASTACADESAASSFSASTWPTALSSAGSKDEQQQRGPALATQKTPLPWPPWVQSSPDAGAAAQLAAYAAGQELGTILLQAQLVARLLCSAQLCAWQLRHGTEGCGPVDAHGSCALTFARRHTAKLGSDASERELLNLCLHAVWRPVHAAMKRPFWEAVTAPAGVSPGAYEKHMRIIADNCATLNAATMCERRAPFAPLFDASVAAALLGMFELNCLGITVESPVEDLRDELRVVRRRRGARAGGSVGGARGGAGTAAEEERAADRLLKQLDSTDVPCDGSAFYALQCCINHARDPNCSCTKSVDDRDGAATLTTARAVAAGEELTISYVGDVGKLAPAVLAAALAEYGIPTDE